MRLSSGLVLRGLGLPLAVAAFWRLVVPHAGLRWPLGLDALFRTDLPLVLPVLALARALAYRLRADPVLVRAERLACLAFALPLAVPFLPLPQRLRVTALVAVFAALVLGWGLLSFLAIGRALSGGRDRSPAAALALLLGFLGVYLAAGRYVCHVAAPTGDEPHYLLVAHSLWQDGDLDLADDFAAAEHRAFYPSEFGPRPWDIRTADGRIYSWGGWAFPALLTVPYGLGGRSGAVAFMNLVTALALLLAYRTGRRLGGSSAGCLAACVAVGCGLPVLAYSSVLYPETLASALFLGALLCFPERPPEPRRLAAATLLLVALALVRAKYLALALPAVLVLALGARHGPARRTLAVFLGALAAYLLVDAAVLQGEYSGRLARYLVDLPQGMLAGGRLSGVAGVWLDQEGGVLFYNPLLAAGLAALLVVARRGRIGLAVAASAAGYALAAGLAYQAWYAEWFYPGRFLVPVLPLLAAAWGGSLPEAPAGLRSPLAPLLGFGLLQAAVLALALIAEPALAYNYADGTASVLDALERRLGLPVGRYFPSLVRPVGPEQLAPIALLAAAAGLLALRRRPWPAPAGALLGVALFAAVWALPLVGAHTVPTRRIEAEDSYVRPHRARPWPEGRPYHQRLASGDLRLGLRLPPRASLAADVVTAEGRVELWLSVLAQGSGARLQVALGGFERAVLDLPSGHWGPHVVYTAKEAGPRELLLRNLGSADLLVDSVEVRRLPFLAPPRRTAAAELTPVR